MTIFNERLKQLRSEKGLVQKDMAKFLNITTSAYGYYEQGKRNPDPKTLMKLSNFFNVSVNYLLGKTDRINNKKDVKRVDKEILDLLQGISKNIEELKKGQEELKEEVKELKTTQEKTNERLDKIELRLDGFSEGIGKLVSDEIGESISTIKTDVKFIKRKVQDTEEDVFVIQDHLKLIK